MTWTTAKNVTIATQIPLIFPTLHTMECWWYAFSHHIPCPILHQAWMPYMSSSISNYQPAVAGSCEQGCLLALWSAGGFHWLQKYLWNEKVYNYGKHILFICTWVLHYKWYAIALRKYVFVLGYEIEMINIVCFVKNDSINFASSWESIENTNGVLHFRKITSVWKELIGWVNQ